MDIARSLVDFGYNLAKPTIFEITKQDPEEAHEKFIRVCKKLHEYPIIERMLLQHSVFDKPSNIPISNAAGFNKNGDIPLEFLHLLGFDRAVIGTVTYEAWSGNPRPRIMRFPESESIVNWMGLPGIGAKAIYERLKENNSPIPITINIMSTPGKSLEAQVQDLQSTVITTRHIKNVDRFELNLSCPNTSHSPNAKLDERKENQKNYGALIGATVPHFLPSQEGYIKVSPDLEPCEIDNIIEVVSRYPQIKGFTATNTTTAHNPRHIQNSPGKGGASGTALHEKSLTVQHLFYTKLKKTNLRLIGCGAINDTYAARQRISAGARELQIYTPLIFRGPGLLRTLREYINKEGYR